MSLKTPETQQALFGEWLVSMSMRQWFSIVRRHETGLFLKLYDQAQFKRKRSS